MKQMRRVATRTAIAVAGVLAVAAAVAVWLVPAVRPSSLLAAAPWPDDEAPALTLTKAAFVVRVPGVGELEPATSLAISVPRVQTGGLKIFWMVKDGSIVAAGDPVVEFDASELIQQLQDTGNNLDAALRQYEASVLRGSADTGAVASDHDVAEMELDKAHTQAPRDADIFTRHEIVEGALGIDLSRTKVEEYSGKIDATRSLAATSQRILVIERSKQQVKQGQLAASIGSLKVLAPRAGMVLVQKDASGNAITIGETRWPGFTLLTMPDTSSMKARVQVLEADAGHLVVGQQASVVVDSHPSRRFPATVERVDAIARALDKDSPVKYVEVLLEVAAPADDVLKPGKMMRADITTTQYAAAIVVPRLAVVDDAGQPVVWLRRPSGPLRTPVQVAPGDAGRVVLVAGVHEGDQVLLDPPRAPSARDQRAAGTTAR